MVLNGSSVSWTVKVSNIVTVTKLSAIAIIIGCGIYQLSIGNKKQHGDEKLMKHKLIYL